MKQKTLLSQERMASEIHKICKVYMWGFRGYWKTSHTLTFGVNNQELVTQRGFFSIKLSSAVLLPLLDEVLTPLDNLINPSLVSGRLIDF